MARSGNEIRRKVYVDVITLDHADGGRDPLMVIWEDGRAYRIEKIYDKKRVAAYHTGSVGLCYSVKIGEKRTHLYWENPRWFVEAIIRE